jgi:serine protease Do
MVTAVNPASHGGVAYAVPIEAVERAYRALAAGKRAQYAWLGLSAATVTPSLAHALDLSVKHGALVQSLSAGGAAERAGLRAGTDTTEVAGETYPRDGDVIVAVGSVPVAGFRDLDRAIAGLRSGETVELHIVRAGDSKSLTVHLLPRPASFANCS